MAEHIILKRCPRCKQAKSITDFSVSLHNTCKYKRQTYCKICQREIKIAYMASDKGRAYKQYYVRSGKKKIVIDRYLEKNRSKHYARTSVNHAIRDKKLPHPEKCRCAKCGNPAKEYHHHNGYEKANVLNVIPVCRDCHYIIHKEDPN
jgi:hypothetical protein